MTTVISLENLGKTYKRSWARQPVPALKNLTLSVCEGEVFGFIGPNGAGKSTAIKILTGALRPSTGQACLFGVPSDQAEARRGMGYVPENPQLYDFLTPIEVLSMGLRLHHTRTDDADKHCMDWLERFELAHVAKKKLRTFSKGMAQRVALAHAMAIKPRLLILDEPLSGLDPVGRRDVVDILAEYKQQGGSIFLTSHVLHDVERLADRFGLIHQGELKMLQSPSDLAYQVQLLTVRSLGTKPVEGMRCESGNRWIGEISAAQLWRVLRDLEAAGHLLQEVRPSLSLEKVFMQTIGQE